MWRVQILAPDNDSMAGALKGGGQGTCGRRMNLLLYLSEDGRFYPEARPSDSQAGGKEGGGSKT